MSNVLVVGCGKLGMHLAMALVAEGHTVWGLRRHPERLPQGIRGVQADLRDKDSLERLPQDMERVFYMVTADAFDRRAYRATYVEGLRNLLLALSRSCSSPPQRIVFASSTSVYGQTDGTWVDEASSAVPESFSGRCMVEAEQLLERSPYASVTLRLGGLYGPGRTRLLDKVRQGQSSLWRYDTRYLNLIHEEDAMKSLIHLSELKQPAPIYIGVDHEPVVRSHLVSWLAHRLGVSLSEKTQRGVPRRLERNSNKRCRNKLLLASGYRFRYPSYREGFETLV